LKDGTKIYVITSTSVVAGGILNMRNVFEGRLTGGQFFLWYLPTALLGVVLKLNLVARPWDGIIALLYLISLPVAVIAAVRRSHDLGHSGWFALITLIPLVGWYLVFKEGNPDTNNYGPAPHPNLWTGL
jgi:uncharacterized membrane protein YhaH (DUF805 family)